MNKLKISPGLLTGIAVALIAFGAFSLRVFPSLGNIFTENWIKYASADAYFHIRLVDLNSFNFPSLSSFDPYIVFPGGGNITGIHMFVRVLASIASFFGMATPDQTAVDVVGVFIPPILTTLSIVVVYFIGKELFGRWGGLLSAAMLAILPGEFLSRTKLGFTDYHCFEILMTSLFILFIILALKAARNNNLSFSDIAKRNWASIRKPVIYSVIASLAFMLYAMGWTGSPLFLFISFSFIVIQFIVDHLNKRDTDYLALVGGTIYLAGFILLIFSPVSNIVKGALGIAFIASLGMGIISRFMRAKELKPVYFPVALLVAAGIGFGIFYGLFSSTAKSMLDAFEIFNPSGAQLTTIEMQPLISKNYGNAFAVVWNNYNTTFFLAFIPMLYLLYRLIRKGTFEDTFLLVWSVIVLIANLGQRRFGYYYGINVGLLIGYLSWLVLDYTRSRIYTEHLKQAVARAKEVKYKALKKNQNAPSYLIPNMVMVFVSVIVFFTAYFWSIQPAVTAAKSVPYAPSNAWCEVLDWTRENTPDPFEGEDVYHELIKSKEYLSYSQILLKYPDETDPLFYKEVSEYYPYPDSAYGVLAWWDYGYWITRMAHRIPNANPSQDPRAIKDVASFMIAQDEEAANEVMNRLGSKYILLDTDSAYVDPTTGSGKFWAMVTWAEQNLSDYFDMFWVQDPADTTQWNRMILYLPEYYQSMAIRLYIFDGEEVTPAFIWVIGYIEQADQNGNIQKIVTASQSFTTLEEAEEFIATQEADEENELTYTLVGTTPLDSCVPLEALGNYGLEYGSSQQTLLVSYNGTVSTSGVKLFSYSE